MGKHSWLTDNTYEREKNQSNKTWSKQTNSKAMRDIFITDKHLVWRQESIKQVLE